jgi:hypothetical protein
MVESFNRSLTNVQHFFEADLPIIANMWMAIARAFYVLVLDFRLEFVDLPLEQHAVVLSQRVEGLLILRNGDIDDRATMRFQQKIVVMF